MLSAVMPERSTFSDLTVVVYFPAEANLTAVASIAGASSSSPVWSPPLPPSSSELSGTLLSSAAVVVTASEDASLLLSSLLLQAAKLDIVSTRASIIARNFFPCLCVIISVLSSQCLSLPPQVSTAACEFALCLSLVKCEEACGFGMIIPITLAVFLTQERPEPSFIQNTCGIPLYTAALYFR